MYVRCVSMCPCVCVYVSVDVGLHVCEWLYHVKVRDELATVDSILLPRGSQGSDFNSQFQLKVLLFIELFHGPTGYIFKTYLLPH